MTKSVPVAFLPLLFVGTVCNAMAVSFMGFYIVESLQRAPWNISVYTGAFALIVILSNRAFAKQMDRGANPFPMIGLAASGYCMAAFALSLSPGFLTVATAGVTGFGIGSSAMSTMFSLGGDIAERNGMKRSTFNAYMRATTSTSWMIGPALSFTLADQFGPEVVFQAAFAISLIWLVLWWRTAPRDGASIPPSVVQAKMKKRERNPELWAAILFVFCLALAHSLTFSALPLFFVQEVSLPGYAPGVAFSIKTIAELFAIFTTPYLIVRFGLRTALMGTAQLAIVAILVLATVRSFPHMLFGAAAEGLYFGLFSTLAISFVQSLSRDRPAHATAMYWNTMMIALVVAGPATGLIAQVSDFQTVIFTGSVFAVASAAILAWSSYQHSENQKRDQTCQSDK
ncbi:MFS transporter [Ruegeria sp. 2205SS24-7]|uniref:MFS transporter n=1 Tax=Ruegeria discodermiae TaxID=3064389 RepID=UPI0027412BD6|nr:MFS transporter [Ruegeria sp. 2205SS24-7]MDP5219795.1 MFS transporter [Ruegeria sp. 2205SS24-7]